MTPNVVIFFRKIFHLFEQKNTFIFLRYHLQLRFCHLPVKEIARQKLEVNAEQI